MKDFLIQPFAAVRRRSKRLVTGIPTDLVGVAGFVVIATVLVTVVDVSSSLMRAAIGLPLLFFVPGYVTVSALFPRRSPARDATAGSRLLPRQAVAVSDVERAALSFGVSFALLPLLALVVAATPWGYTGPVVVATVACFAVIGAGLAAVRRLSVPAADRYSVAFDRRLEAARAAIFDAESSLQVAVNVALVLAVVLAMTTAGYAFVAPQDGEQYTSLRLLTENESGELVASGYPSDIESGESIPLVVGIENQEEQSLNYTVVVQQQRLENDSVVERTELQRFSRRVGEGATEYADRNVTPTADEGTVRISVLLYADGVPETPTHENAYRHAYFWTNVTESERTLPEDGGGTADTGGGDEEGDDPFDDLIDDDGTDDGSTDDGGGNETVDDGGGSGGNETVGDGGGSGGNETEG